MGLKSPFLVPLLLLTGAAFFFIKDANKPSTSEPSSAPATGASTTVAPKRSTPQGNTVNEKCLQRSKKIYNDEISEFKVLERKLGYFRLRNDRYGKGFNTIIKEQLSREAEC